MNDRPAIQIIRYGTRWTVWLVGLAESPKMTRKEAEALREKMLASPDPRQILRDDYDERTGRSR